MISIREDGLPRLASGKASIRSAMEEIEKSSLSVALIVDSRNRLLGIVTDGDVRRALLAGADLRSSVTPHMNKAVITASERESRAAVLDLMMSRIINHVPVLDDDGQLVGLHTLRNLIGCTTRENAVLILAGGRGTRLGQATRKLPKPMVRVAGRPILERLINHCVGFGFTNITLSVSYLAEDIINYFGNGDQVGCQITYLHDRDGEPRGTGGPFVDFIRDNPDCDDPILVINGDLVTDANLSAFVDSHNDTDALMTIATYDYMHEVPFGVIEVEASGTINKIDEKPLLSVPVSAGIYALSPEVAQRLPEKGLLPMTEIVRKLLGDGSKVRAFPITTDWVDVGSPSDLGKARGTLDHL